MHSQHPEIKNVVFDIGNVLVRWSPEEIVHRTFGDTADIAFWVRSIFLHPVWTALNLGEMTESEAIDLYHTYLDIPRKTLTLLFYHIKETQTLIPGTQELLHRLRLAGYRTFALTDNIHEIMQHLRQRYSFWNDFQGVVVSAELHIKKPDLQIFNYLLKTYQLDPAKTVFTDDLALNIHGAQQAGLHGIQFHNADQLECSLRGLGVQL